MLQLEIAPAAIGIDIPEHQIYSVTYTIRGTVGVHAASASKARRTVERLSRAGRYGDMPSTIASTVIMIAASDSVDEITAESAEVAGTKAQ